MINITNYYWILKRVLSYFVFLLSQNFTLLFCFILYPLSFVNAQSMEEIQKLESEYKKVLEMQALQKSNDILDSEKTIKSTDLPDKLIYTRKDVESLLANTEKLLQKLKFMEDSTETFPFIGYEIFTQRDTIAFWQNLPIPHNYSLGPGDEVIISLWGETESYSSNIINRDGQIFLQNVGTLNLAGKTVDDAKEYIISKYSRVYSTLIGDKPKSFLDITLGELKSVNVHFVGFVNIPGVHMIHPFSNIVTGLTQAGGVKNNGTLRNIQIIRDSKVIGIIDLYNYIIFGKGLGDLRLLDQDIIYVPPRVSTIPLSGKVKTPGYYEILNNESIYDLITISGGIDSKASTNIFYYKENNNLAQEAFLLKTSDVSEFLLSDGDSIHVPIKPKKENLVFIAGQIKNPGEYPYQINMSLRQLIEATMTTNDLEFMKTVDLSNIIINRKNPIGESPVKIIADLNKKDFILKNGDFITISRTLNFQPIESIIITGEVITPGLYAVNNITSLESVLQMAGGYTNNALIEGIEVFRDSLKIGWEKSSFLLNDGDSLNVLKKSGLVLLDGEVNNPGYVNYKKGESIKKYIKRAGGYSAFANPKDVFILYPNGIAKPLTKWNSPKVLEGSTIIIKQRALSAYSNGSTNLQVVQELSSVAGNIATTLITLVLLINQSKGA
jgi:protein involved in polysaccharide export with SLBB domain